MPLLADEWWHIYFMNKRKTDVLLYIQIFSKKIAYRYYQ